MFYSTNRIYFPELTVFDQNNEQQDVDLNVSYSMSSDIEEMDSEKFFPPLTSTPVKNSAELNMVRF